uniref:Uncharacterized protein AlNc14C88G5611 n=1 Tax=Albugo laibachii Nc14 TaxID=890382 RepID=F0WG81_9STRA|nr:conserved hypothetical protein [Albugo laibachii Nc14]|eukprot:CCA20216.1 conserved hypothetical protein [Albugo laibachii Nc14]
MAISWPLTERHFSSSMPNCPSAIKRLVTYFQRDHPAKDRVDAENLKIYTLEELKKYDGSDASSPILLAVGGKVLDVTTGSKFYGVGKTYNIFAGTACTRALAISSLEKQDISDKVDDFNEEQRKELQSILKFYHEKYPTVGVLEDTNT